jgi:antitoxin (DNA-binding transcriptional repressor) of toxin-antitoxin stability system
MARPDALDIKERLVPPCGSGARPMITIGIGQFRSDTRNYVHRAKAGESFKVLRRGRPVVELHGAQSSNCGECQWVPLAVVRSRAALIFERVFAGETIAIAQRGEVLAALHRFAEANHAAVGSQCESGPGGVR